MLMRGRSERARSPLVPFSFPKWRHSGPEGFMGFFFRVKYLHSQRDIKDMQGTMLGNIA